jgi:hypothetical protein
VTGKTSVIAAALTAAALLPFSTAHALNGRDVGVTGVRHSGNWTGPCPARMHFSGGIVARQPGTVRYQWVRSDGARSGVSTVTFSAPGKDDALGYVWQIDRNYRGWVGLTIVQPGGAPMKKISFTVSCR